LALNGTAEITQFVRVLAENNILGFDVQVIKVACMQFHDSIQNLQQNCDNFFNSKSFVLDLKSNEKILLHKGSYVRILRECSRFCSQEWDNWQIQ
jgi:hypothetical protein